MNDNKQSIDAVPEFMIRRYSWCTCKHEQDLHGFENDKNLGSGKCIKRGCRCKQYEFKGRALRHIRRLLSESLVPGQLELFSAAIRSIEIQDR